MWLNAATLILVSVIGLVGRQKMNTIHYLVNQRMTDALGKIDELVAYIDATAKHGDPPKPDPTV